jgi:hypothetical protein
MTWLLWRQTRFQLTLTAALVATLGVLLFAIGLRMGHPTSSVPYDAIVTLLRITVALPLVLGVFYGADLVGPDGRSVRGPIPGPQTLCPSAVDRASMNACMDKVRYHIKTVFHPGSQYWPMRWIETGIFVVRLDA